MMGIQKSNIVKLFISSNCDSANDRQNGITKYGIMRKSLKLLLESTDVCDVFVFEEGTATSYDVVSSYMNPLEDSDLVIVIVDNKDGIGNGTQKEISRVAALKKKCIYVFCNEREKEPTELEKQIKKDTSSPKCITVSEFSKIPEEVYKSVINDILCIYRSYCRGRMDFMNNLNCKETVDNTEFSVADDSYFTKEYLSQFACTKALLKKEAGLFFEAEPQITDKDKHCSELLGFIIGSQITDAPLIDLIAKDVKSFHKGNMQKLVSIRYEAIASYLIGDLSGCISKLEDAITFIGTCKNIPKWILNDVALDLRNIQVEINHEKGIMEVHPHGQKILDEDNEPLYYPIIDRIVSDYSESIIKSSFIHTTQSPYTTNIGGADYTIEKTANAFIVAYYYGSITQMLIIRKRICDFTLGLSLNARNHRIFMFTVRLLLLSCDEKNLRLFLDAYGENTNSINSDDVNSLLDSINKQPIKYRNIVGRTNILRFFGYYYSDIDFKRESEKLICDVKDSLITDYTAGMLIKPLLDAMNNTSYRFCEKDALEFVMYIFEKQYKRFYYDAFHFLYNFRFSKLSNTDQKKYQSFLINLLKDETINNNDNNIYLAIQTLRQNEKISHTPLDKALKKHNASFYENTYLLNVENLDVEQGWKYIKGLVEKINNDNEMQGKGGVYTSKVYDPYLTIYNILDKVNLEFNLEQLSEILDALSGTIFAKTQTIEAKVRALELLCIIQLRQPSNNQITILYKDIINRREEILETMKFTLDKGFSKANINFIICILGLIIKPRNDNEICIRLVEILNCDFAEQINALSFLEKLFKDKFVTYLKKSFDVLFQFLLNESYSKNSDVRFRSMAVMTLIHDSRYRKICLERFINIMDDEDYKGKVGLLYRLNEEDLGNPQVKFIFDKGKADTHYWVRVAANRFN